MAFTMTFCSARVSCFGSPRTVNSSSAISQSSWTPFCEAMPLTPLPTSWTMLDIETSFGFVAPPPGTTTTPPPIQAFALCVRERLAEVIDILSVKDPQPNSLRHHPDVMMKEIRQLNFLACQAD